MHSTHATARQAGAIYFVFMIVAIFGEFFLPAFLVPGDATATARSIIEGERSYRFAILTGLATHVIFILLAVILYRLFKETDESLALLMVLLVTVGVTVALANQLNKFAPLVLLSGPDYAAALGAPQRDALTLGFLGFHRAGAAFPIAFWGLWLLPFGVLVVRSGFLPKLLGILLIVAGFAYLTSSVTAIALPEYRAVVNRVMMPLYFGEVPIIFWLLIKGARVPQPPW